MNSPVPDRVKIVTKELLFHEVMGLVEFNHAGHLNSYEADAKEAARARLYRAFAITKDVDKHHHELIRCGNITNVDLHNRIRLQRVAQLEGLRQIREFAPELAATDTRDYFGSLFEHVRQEYAADVLFRASPRVRHTRARNSAMNMESLIVDMVEDGYDRDSWEVVFDICRMEVERIRVFAPELVLAEDGTDISYSMQRVILNTAWVCE
jgi:hypothetical protein